jgi:HlyD family secretion protein
MKKKIVAILLAVGLVGGFSLWSYARSGRASAADYRFVPIEQGDLQSRVSATGTLSAVTTVQVGTQVSGIISKLFVDFNDHVVKGQVLALIDPTLLQIAVQNAAANLEKADAQFGQAKRDYERAVALHAQQIISETDFSTAQGNLELTQANAKGAAVALAQARQNLGYATIAAPISGTVVERDVDVGQTVAASLATPQLFRITGDLTRMQILVSVDESDISHIREGQTARFKVQAYPNESFTGTVRQVRLQSTVQQNVVDYTVVVDVRNDDRRLLPGMTATVDFVVASAKDVFKVANAALRVVPTAQMLAELNLSPTPQGARQARLFYVSSQGRLGVIPVKSGLSDGQQTEVQGSGLQAGMQVIGGVTQASQGAAANPFQSQAQGAKRTPGSSF